MVTIKGWDGHGSAGNVLESYIIQKYIEADIAPFSGRQFSNQQISAAEITSSISATRAEILSLKNITLEYLCNRVASLTKDSGIDAIILDSNTDDASAINITAIIKSGMLKETIVMGNAIRKSDPSKHFVAFNDELKMLNLMS